MILPTIFKFSLSPIMTCKVVRGLGSCLINKNTNAVSMMLSQSIAGTTPNQSNMPRRQVVRDLRIGSKTDEMKPSVQYKLMQAGQEQEVCDLVIRVFNEFVAHQYSDDGIQEFLKYVEPHCLSERCQGDDFVVLAMFQGKIIGMIEFVKNSHISLFYTEGEHQRTGIGRGLLKKALEISVKGEPTITGITVNSSPNAVNIYEKLGFYVTESEQVKNGIRFVPMKLEISNS